MCIFFVVVIAAACLLVPDSEISNNNNIQVLGQSDFKLSIRVQFPTARAAEIAGGTMSVDAELQPDKVSKVVFAQGSCLHM